MRRLRRWRRRKCCFHCSRAYFHAKARRDVYVELPEQYHQEKMRGKLKKAMCGTRGAAQNWELQYTEMMVKAGSTQGSYSARVFYHKEKCTRAVVHGDDFTVLGFKSRLQRRKPGAVRILNRIVMVLFPETIG